MLPKCQKRESSLKLNSKAYNLSQNHLSYQNSYSYDHLPVQSQPYSSEPLENSYKEMSNLACGYASYYPHMQWYVPWSPKNMWHRIPDPKHWRKPSRKQQSPGQFCQNKTKQNEYLPVRNSKCEQRSNFGVKTENRHLKNNTTEKDHKKSIFEAGTSIKTENLNKTVLGKNTYKNHSTERESHLFIRVSDKSNDLPFWKNYFRDCFRHEDFSLEKCENQSDVFNVKFKSLQKTKKAMKMFKRKTRNKTSSTPEILHMHKCGAPNASSSSSPSLKTKINELITSCQEYLLEKKQQYLNQYKNQIAEFQAELEDWKKMQNFNNENLLVWNLKSLELERKKIVFIKYSKLVLNKLNELNDLTIKQCAYEISNIKKDYTRECGCFISGFPIYSKKDNIISVISQNQVCVIIGETGSGKSTQITQHLWREGFGNNGMIVCTQPKRNTVIAIAKYVSSQMGDVIGGLVGYKVGLSVKKSTKTKILYMTDYILLEEFLSNPEVTNVSCIIIDEVHERCLWTDLLLGLIKNSLHSRPDLRIIITSATIDAKIFVEYFNLSSNAVITIPGNMYPVKEVWKSEDVKLGWNYLKESVDLACDLHITEKPGDILIFLATPDETEEAVSMLSSKMKQKNIKELPAMYSLHGKQNLEEYFKCMSFGNEVQRKIIFTTNFAETSYTIPSVRFVIDCGVAKEMKYCPERNTNLLVMRFVSKSSARQRKGRVGRTCEGICFHLYSKRNFLNMPDETVPEILQINLTRALLLLCALGIEDPFTFPFIASPSAIAINFAKESLTQLGAIKNGRLTPLGCKMVKLPLDPCLSKLVFQGIDEQIGYISVVTSAAASASEKIFHRDKLNAEEADKKKITFCHDGGDYITFLTVFKEWLSIPYKKRSVWCKENYINFRGMKIINQIIVELKAILSKEFSLHVRRLFPNNSFGYSKLQKIIFLCFSNHLCALKNDGYVSPHLPGPVFIHPSSSLRYSRWPKYLVYDTVLETSKVYLLNVTPVSEEMIHKAAKMGTVSCDLLNDVVLQPVLIQSVGETIMLRDLLGQGGCKVKILEQKIKVLSNNNQSHIQLNVLNGEVAIYTPSKFHTSAEEMVRRVINVSKMKMLSEEEVISLFGIASLRVTIGCGAEVKDVILPGDFREIDVDISQSSSSIKCITEQLKEFGKIQNIQVLTSERKQTLRATFVKVSPAKKAVESLGAYGMKVQPVLQQTSHVKSPCPPFQIKVNWPRRLCSGSASITFKSEEDFLEASHLLCTSHFSVQGNFVKVYVRDRNTLVIQNLPLHFNEDDIRQLLWKRLPSKEGIKNITLHLQKPFVSSLAEIRNYEKQMFQLFGKFTPSLKLRVEVIKPECKDVEWTSNVYFEDTADGEKAVQQLHGKKLGLYPIKLKSSLQTTLKCSMTYFKAVKDRVQTAILTLADQLKSKSSHLEIELKTISDGSHLLITITSDNSVDMASARHSFVEILKGDVIECINDPRRKKLFSRNGQKFLKNLSKRTDTYIHSDHRKKIISIFGCKDSSCTVKNEIESYLNQLDTEDIKEFFLSDSSRPKGLLREFARRYEFNLQEFQHLFELSSVELCATKHKLIMQGSEQALNKAEKHLEELCEKLGKERTQDDDLSRPCCPICLGAVSITSYRLEYCGHMFCRDCLALQIEARVIPLLCPEEGCGKPFVVEDIKKILIGKSHLSGPLYEEALRQFVEKHDELCYCPAPDCPMVHRIMSSLYPTYCHVCKNDICTQCKSIYHYGMTCKEYQLRKNSEKCIKVWLDEDRTNRKLCTKCYSPIEKYGGCNHMMCAICQSHLCWLCMDIFDSAQLVYDHLPNCLFNN